MTATIIEPGTIEAPPGDLTFLRLPERDLFRVRAERLDALASGHALADYLKFLAGMARAQHTALALVRDVSLPTSEQMERCREHGLPPLGTQGWQRAPLWRDVLRHILVTLESGALPEAARATIGLLKQTDDADLERLADQLLGGDYQQLDRASAPFVAAALQVYWLHTATSLGANAFGRLETPSLCPVCGSPPVASVVRIGAADQGLRYLSCSLCNSQWHMVRIKCSSCESTKGIGYYGIEGASAAIKAESCDICHSYLKIFYMDKDPQVDAVADDVASVALDVLMSESGVARSGMNYFLIGGDA
ncbi:MAG: formate dehydrogenase accessory protein FdhE [Pseudomonadota bacterium]